MLARWQFQAKFGHKGEAVNLLKEWIQEIGAQTDVDMKTTRLVTGSVGASEGLVQMEVPIEGLHELESFFAKIAKIKLHQDWGKKMSEVVVSGSTHWNVFRIIE